MSSELKFWLIFVFGALMFFTGALIDSYEVNRKYGVPMFWRGAPYQCR